MTTSGCSPACSRHAARRSGHIQSTGTDRVAIGSSPAPPRTHSINSARLRSSWSTSRSRSSGSSTVSRWNVPPGGIALTCAVHLALKSGSSASSTVRFESAASLVFVSEIRATSGTEFSTIATLSWLAASISTATGCACPSTTLLTTIAHRTLASGLFGAIRVCLTIHGAHNPALPVANCGTDAEAFEGVHRRGLHNGIGSSATTSG